jgi:hypothetical protein
MSCGTTRTREIRIDMAEPYHVVLTTEIPGCITAAGKKNRSTLFEGKASLLNLDVQIYRSPILFYDCRNDGSFRKRIRLPTRNPFYLLRYRAPCQRVRGMYVREETVHFDDEDSRNKNSAQGWYPLGAGGRDHDLHYCFYRP